MESKEIIKEYSNGELSVVWKPNKCIHSGVCVQTLPKVYSPSEKPWIKADRATTEELKSQIANCPSGALSYRMEGQSTKDPAFLETKIEVKPNGPLLIYGSLNVFDKSGKLEVKNKTTAFCRCGSSSNKPYCDGTHVKVEFKD